jgi:hypothetical protein
MKSLNPTRIVMGIIVFVGLLFFKPLAYFAAAMMIFAGLTGICFLEKLLSKVFGSGASCSTAANPAADLQRMTPEEIKQAVKEKYSEVASNPQAKFNFPVGRKFAESVGYSGELLDKLPQNDFLKLLSSAGFSNPRILWTGRNARTGHELALCAVIRAEKSNRH